MGCTGSLASLLKPGLRSLRAARSSELQGIIISLW